MQTIYAHGAIMTMTREGVYAEAILVADGKLAQTGTLSHLQQAVPAAEVINLEVRKMMPAFLDGRSHLSVATIEIRCYLIVLIVSNCSEVYFSKVHYLDC